MKKIVTTLAVLVVLGIGASVAQAAPVTHAKKATGANCSATIGPIIRYTDQGYHVMKADATIYGCTQVEAIEWRWLGGGFPDCSTNPCVFHQAYLHGCQCDVNRINPGTGSYTESYTQTCWYSGSHPLYAEFYMHVKNSATHTWGSWTYFTTGNPSQNVSC